MHTNLLRFAAVAMLGAAVGWFGIPSMAQSGDTYKTRLAPMPGDNKSKADWGGAGTASAVLSGTKLTVTGAFDGLKTNAVSAKIHNGIVAGVRGPAIGDLTVTKGMSGTISGSIDLNPDQLAHLKKGGLYVQVYSERPADGTLWGWLTK